MKKIKLNTEIKKVLGVDNQNLIYCVSETNDNNFNVIIYQPITKKQLKYLNSVAYIKESLEDSLTLDDIKKQFGSLTKAIESIKIETLYSDNFFPTQDNSYICDYYDELCTISKKSIFGFIPVTFTCVGSVCIKIEELTNFKYIHNKELFCDIVTKVKHS